MSLSNEDDQLDESTPGLEILEPSKGSKKWIGAAAGVAVVVALTVGGAAIVNAMNGGGPQPEDVLPANAMAFAKLDLNPSAGQKLAAYQLANKFPRAKEKVTSQESSIKESIFGSIFNGSSGKDNLGLNYKKDIEPWLGDRIGVGVYPDSDGDKQPEFGIAIAYNDQNAAKVALDKGIAAAKKEAEKQAKMTPPPSVMPKPASTVSPAAPTPHGDKAIPPADGTMPHGDMPDMPDMNSEVPMFPGDKPTTIGYAFGEGFVIVSDTTAHATALVNAGKKSTLATSAESKYAEDVKSLGSDQIAVAWTDIAAIYKAIPANQRAGSPEMFKGLGPKDPSKASGRIVMGLHADPSFLEVTGKSIEVKGADTLFTKETGSEAGIISSFPADVFGAVTITGLGKAAGTLYTSLTAGKDEMGIKPGLSQLGIDSAAEIETLLGAETGIMVGGTKDVPEFAVRTRGKDADAALKIASKALAAPEAGNVNINATKITGPDGIVVSMGSGLDKAIFDLSGPKLGASEAFRKALPDADTADATQYLNFANVSPLLFGEGTKEEGDWLKPLAGFGVTGSTGNDGTFRARLTVK